jgi:hypothetical protein
MTANAFVYLMMTLNACASIAYVWQGDWVKALYWACAFGLNFCVVQMRG